MMNPSMWSLTGEVTYMYMCNSPQWSPSSLCVLIFKGTDDTVNPNDLLGMEGGKVLAVALVICIQY